MAYLLGGKVSSSEVREYGKTPVRAQANAALFQKVPEESVCWMSHTDYIAEPPAGLPHHRGAAMPARVAAMAERRPGVFMRSSSIRRLSILYMERIC